MRVQACVGHVGGMGESPHVAKRSLIASQNSPQGDGALHARQNSPQGDGALYARQQRSQGDWAGRAVSGVVSLVEAVTLSAAPHGTALGRHEGGREAHAYIYL